MLSLRLAWRNLWRHKRRTWLTATAMIFSNVLLVFMICLQFGSYDMMIGNTLRLFSGHLQVQHTDYHDNPRLRSSIAGVTTLADELREALHRAAPGARVAARATAFALASSEQRSFGVQVIGVQPEAEPGVSSLPGLIAEGRYLRAADGADQAADRNGEIVIGTVMARNLKVGVGDEITLLGSGHDGSFAAAVVQVVGLFESGSQDMDRSFAEVPLGYFQEVFAMGDRGNAITVALDRLEAVPAATEAARAVIAGRKDLAVLDWSALHPGLRQAIRADMASAWLTYGVLIVLVAFSVLNTQLMSVMERTREFGVISALGVRPRRLAALIMLETALMAGVGFALGLLLGALVSGYFQVHGFTYPGMAEIAERFNLPEAMYPRVSAFSLLLGPAVVFGFCLLAAVYPALRLLRLQPVQAMRAA